MKVLENSRKGKFSQGAHLWSNPKELLPGPEQACFSWPGIPSWLWTSEGLLFLFFPLSIEVSLWLYWTCYTLEDRRLLLLCSQITWFWGATSRLDREVTGSGGCGPGAADCWNSVACLCLTTGRRVPRRQAAQKVNEDRDCLLFTNFSVFLCISQSLFQLNSNVRILANEI